MMDPQWDIVIRLFWASLMLTVSVLVMQTAIWLLRPSSPVVRRIGWFVVLFQGVLLFHIPIEVTWQTRLPQTPIARQPASDFEENSDARPGLSGLPVAASDSRRSVADEPFETTTAGRTSLPLRESSNRLNWKPLAVLIWIVGFLCVSVFAGLTYLLLLRRLLSSWPACDSWTAQWHELLDSQGVRRSIPLRVTGDLGPMLCWTPLGYRVFVPDKIWNQLHPSQRLAILRHELAHFERRDVWKTLAVRLLAMVHWFNPLAWWAVRQFVQDGEWACDRAAAGRDYRASLEYAKALMCVAGQSPRCPSCATAIRGGSMFVRIRRIISLPSKEDGIVKKMLLLSPVIGLLVFGLFRVELVAEQAASKPEPADELTARHRTMGEGDQGLPWLPDGLVAVFGEERGRKWGWLGRGLALRPDGGQLAAGGANGAIFVWDATDLHLEAFVKGHEGAVISVGYMPDGQTLVSVGQDKTIRTWDLSGDEPRERTTISPHRERPTRAVWSADRKTLVTRSSRDGETRIWRLQAGGLVDRGELPRRDDKKRDSDRWREAMDQMDLPRTKGVMGMKDRETLALSSDGRLLAVSSGGAAFWVRRDGGATPTYLESRITVWQIGGPKPTVRCVLEKTGYVYSIAFHADGNTLAVGSHDNKVRLYDLGDAKPPVKHILEHDEVGGLSFSPDGKTLAVGGSSISFWDLSEDDPIELSVFPLTHRPPFDVRDMTFGVDGKLFFVVDGCVIRRWELDRPIDEVTGARSGHSEWVDSLSFTPDGNRLLSTASLDGTMRIWDFATLETKEQHVLRFVGLQVKDVAVAPGGDRFVFSTYKNSAYALRLWEFAKPEPHELNAVDLGRGHPGAFYSYAFTPDAATLATGHRDGAIRFWDIRDGEFKPTVTIPSIHSGGVCSLDYSADANTLASADWGGHINLWDVSGPTPQLLRRVGGHDDKARQVRFSPDSKRLASGDEKGTIKLWDLTQEESSGRELKQHTDMITAIAFASDGRSLLTSGRDGRVIIWDAAAGKAVRRWEFPGSVWDAKFDPSGRYIVSANGNGSIYVWRNPQAVRR